MKTKTGAFALTAPKLMGMGLSPLPIKRGEKRPAIKRWQDFCRRQPNSTEFSGWMESYQEYNVGLALGASIGEQQLIAIDVDDDTMIDRVRYAIMSDPPAKIGKKGITFFMLADSKVTNTKFVNRAPDRKSGTLVEILALGSQTVLPPSIHPEGMEYRWVGESLLESDVSALPILTDAMIDEITAYAHGKGEHFDALNTMIWKGEDGGGNTHDTCVAAVACLVARQWLDGDIVRRIDYAKLRACERNGDSYQWPHAERVIREWIESARSKGMDTTSKTRRIPTERMVAEAIVFDFNNESTRLLTHLGRTFSYRDGYWRAMSADELRRVVLTHDRSLTLSQINAITTLVQVQTMVEEFGGFNKRVCLKNGTFNLESNTLELWAPEHEITHQLPFEWDDDAKCPLYDDLVEQTFNGDYEAIQLWDEYAAYTLVPDMSFHKMVFLVGPGGSGKTTLSNVLHSIHDPSAVSSTPVTALHDERMRSMLVGKLLNISSEQSRLNPVADDYLKKITGGDLVDVRFLYKDSVSMRLTVRFLELANDLPTIKDVSDAIRRRLFILTCPNKVKNPDRHLSRKLLAERPGILKRWTKAFRDLYKRGEFLEPESSREEVDIFLRESDPVITWFDERVVHDDTGSIGDELYFDFIEWSKRSGYNPRDIPTRIVWGKRLTAMGYPSIKPSPSAVIHVRIRKLKLRDGLGGRF